MPKQHIHEQELKHYWVGARTQAIKSLIVICTVLVAISCDNKLSTREAWERAPFPLYLPAELPDSIDPVPIIEEYADSMYSIEVYYYRHGESSPVLHFIITSNSLSHSDWPYIPHVPSSRFRGLMRTQDGRLIGILQPKEYACWHMMGPGETTCKYESTEFIGAWWPGEGAWYELYSLLPLSETLAVIETMEPVSGEQK